MINIKENERLEKLNHSCAHLLAQAVQHLYPGAKFWVGPAIEEGFYYDIDLGDEVIKEEDLELESSLQAMLDEIEECNGTYSWYELKEENYIDPTHAINVLLSNVISDGLTLKEELKDINKETKEIKFNFDINSYLLNHYPYKIMLASNYFKKWFNYIINKKKK